jgi:hypothetical protein
MFTAVGSQTEGTKKQRFLTVPCSAPKDTLRSAAAAQHSSSEQEVDHRPQISSASRFTAGAFQYNLVITANGDLAPSDADPYRIEGEQPPITVGALIISLVRTTM